MHTQNTLPNKQSRLKEGDLFLSIDFGSTITKIHILQYHNKTIQLLESQNLLSEVITAAKDPSQTFLQALNYIENSINRKLIEQGLLIIDSELKSQGIAEVYLTGNPEIKNHIKLLEHFKFTSAEEVMEIAGDVLTALYPHLSFVDIGSQYSRFGYYNGSKWQTAFSHGGVGSGFKNVLPTVVSFDKIFEWIPHIIQKDEIEDYIGNKVAFSHMIPGSQKDLMVEQALLRTTLRKYGPKDIAKSGQDGYILLSGGSFAGTPSLADCVLMALDGLQPYGVQIILRDKHNLAGSLTLIGQAHEKTIKRTLESDEGPLSVLATCISIQGEKQAGDEAGKALCDFGLDEKMEIPLKMGELYFVPTLGREVDLTFELKKPLHVESEQIGEQMDSIVRTRSGGKGVVIDVRGRPFSPPQDNQKGKKQLTEWRRALSELELVEKFEVPDNE